MTAKRKTTKKPKTKIVYRTKKVYVERKDDNPFSDVNKMVVAGAGAVITVGVANAVVNGLKGL